ncbi:MAG: VCBS repeat-containing protein [Planctomycetota bacterium]
MRLWRWTVYPLLSLLAPAGVCGEELAEGRELLIEAPLSGVAALSPAPGEPTLLVVARHDGLEIRRWFEAGDGGLVPPIRLERGNQRLLAWCVAGGADGREKLYVLREDGSVVTLDGGSPDPVLALEKSRPNLPHGVYHVQFARDLNGDGLIDLVVPGLDGLELYFGSKTGFVVGPAVRHRVSIDVTVDEPTEDSPRVAQEITIPLFEVEDQNGDGHPDLVFRDNDHVQFFWSRADGSLPEEPTFALDLEQIRSELPARSRDLIDTSNLLRVLESRVSHLSRDFNGDGYFDLLLRRGRKVSLYRGGKEGVDRTNAVQVLKTSGNLLTAFALDDDQDGRSDLCLLRVGDVSLGQLIFWLVAGGDLTLDLFVYAQQEDLRFTRKPVKTRTLHVSIPSVASLMSGFEERIENIGEEVRRVPVRGDFDGDGERDDLVRLVSDEMIEIYSDLPLLPEVPFGDSAWLDVLRRFDQDAGGKSALDVELEDLIDWVPLPGRELTRLIQDRTPTRVLEIPSGEDEDTARSRTLFVLDVDADGVDDLILSERKDAASPLRLVLLRGLR